MKRSVFLLLLLGLLALPGTVSAQEPSVEAEQIECVPFSGNAVAWVTVSGAVPESTLRLYFRRLNDTVEDLYWVRMQPDGNGRYWAVLPKIEDHELNEHELARVRDNARAAWWRAKQASVDRDPNRDLNDELIEERASIGKVATREWMDEMTDEQFERFVDRLENEPVEYYAVLVDGFGTELARSKTMVAEVLVSCESDLTLRQQREAQNLVIGESAPWQSEEQPFHWLCDGIVTRVDPSGIKMEDQVCRTCINNPEMFKGLRRRVLISPLVP